MTRNPVFSKRTYEILLAQKADPRREIQSVDDAARVLRYGLHVVETSPAPSIEQKLLDVARRMMEADEAGPGTLAGIQAYRHPPEITYEQYWHAVEQLAAAISHELQQKRPQMSRGWMDGINNHPMTQTGAYRADILRHTAHLESARDPSSPWEVALAEQVDVRVFLEDAAKSAMAYDVLGEVRSPVPHYAPNPVFSRRSYEVALAQRLDPRTEIQTTDHAAWVGRYTLSNPHYSPWPSERVPQILIELARQAMAMDEADPTQATARMLAGTAEGHVLTYEEYWDTVAHVAAIAKKKPKLQVVALVNQLPLMQRGEMHADVLRHTAHLAALDRPALPRIGGPGQQRSVVDLHGYLLDVAQEALFADVMDQSGSMVPPYAPNARTCRTRLRGYVYPCQLTRLDGFEDVSYGNDENDSVRFRIGQRWYWLFIGPDDESLRRDAEAAAARDGQSLTDYLGIPDDSPDDEIVMELRHLPDFRRYQLSSDMDPDEAYSATDELEADDETDLMAYLGELVVASRKQQLGSQKQLRQNPLGPRMLQIQRLGGEVRSLPRLGSEHVDWSLLEDDPWSLPPGTEWIVVLRCGAEKRLKGPLSRRYERMSHAGMREQELRTARAIARGCFLDVVRDQQLWREWGQDTPEYRQLSLPALFERYRR